MFKPSDFVRGGQFGTSSASWRPQVGDDGSEVALAWGCHLLSVAFCEALEEAHSSPEAVAEELATDLRNFKRKIRGGAPWRLEDVLNLSLILGSTIGVGLQKWCAQPLPPEYFSWLGSWVPGTSTLPRLRRPGMSAFHAVDLQLIVEELAGHCAAREAAGRRHLLTAPLMLDWAVTAFIARDVDATRIRLHDSATLLVDAPASATAAFAAMTSTPSPDGAERMTLEFVRLLNQTSAANAPEKLVVLYLDRDLESTLFVALPPLGPAFESSELVATYLASVAEAAHLAPDDPLRSTRDLAVTRVAEAATREGHIIAWSTKELN